MDLNSIRRERDGWLKWKNIIPLQEALSTLPNIYPTSIEYGDCIKIEFDDIKDGDKKQINSVAKKLIPWRKGPFCVSSTYIDSEWQSNIKYNLLEPYFDLNNKTVADIGCNNGYYMFRMLEDNPKK